MSAAPRSAAATVCAGKQFNRGAAFSPVELTSISPSRDFPCRFSLHLPVEVFSTIKRDAVDPFVSRFSHRISSAKAKHFQVSARSETVVALRDYLALSWVPNGNHCDVLARTSTVARFLSRCALRTVPVVFVYRAFTGYSYSNLHRITIWTI